jgi:hypothetical protein
MFYFFEIQNPVSNETIKHIVEIHTASVLTFPYSDDNPNKQRVDAWIAEGNTLEEWQPASEPVIEETPAGNTEEEPVIEDISNDIIEESPVQEVEELEISAEPVIEEETSDSTDEEPFTEDGN